MERSTAEARSVYRGMRFIDLSLTLSEELPCSWPDHMPFQQKIYNWFADNADGPQALSGKRGPYQTRWLAIDEHTGTHIDAPNHGVPPPRSGLPGASDLGLISVAELDFSQTSGPAVVINLTHLVGTAEPGASPPVGPEQIERHESEHGRLEPGDVVLMRADWSDRYLAGADGADYAVNPLQRQSDAWPALTVDAVRLLIDRGIRCLGTDAPSVGAAEAGGPVHDIGFAGGMVFVEGLTRLKELPETGTVFMALPLRLAGGTGSPVRAVAIEMEGDGLK